MPKYPIPTISVTPQSNNGKMRIHEPVIGIGERTGLRYFRTGGVPEQMIFKPLIKQPKKKVKTQTTMPYSMDEGGEAEIIPTEYINRTDNSFQSAYDKYKRGEVGVEAIRATQPSNTAEADLYDQLLYGKKAVPAPPQAVSQITTQPQAKAPAKPGSLNTTAMQIIKDNPDMPAQETSDLAYAYQTIQQSLAAGEIDELGAIDLFTSLANTLPSRTLFQGANKSPELPLFQGATKSPEIAYSPQNIYGTPRITPPRVGTGGLVGQTVGTNNRSMPLSVPTQNVTIPDFVHGGNAIITPDVVSAIQQSFPEREWNTALHIIAAESKGNVDAIGGAGEVGIFQIHPINWPMLSTILGTSINAQTLRDPYLNAKAAAIIWQNSQGWGRVSGNPWSTAPGVFRGLNGY